jgi:predicted nucleotide-binding protein (sugar kinase/HSP70/actin superfamily)
MGDYYIPIKTFLERIGGEVIVPPPISKRTIELGCKYSPEFVCFPFKITLGCLIEALEQGADTLLQSGRRGSCRYGYYKEVQEVILKDLGYEFKFARFVSLESFKEIDKNITRKQILESIKIGWAKIKVMDKFEDKVRRESAYEINVGESRKLYQKFLDECKKVESLNQVKELEKKFQYEFSQIKKDTTIKPLKVGIVGELYIVMEPYSNLNIERELNQMGVEVIRPLCLTSILMEVFVPWKSEKPLFRKISRPYLRYDAGAHANASVAETIMFARKGIDGVIHIKPHGCMPEVTAMSVLHRVSKDYDIPILFLSFDEHASSVGIKTRVEAFVELLKRRRLKNVSRHRCWLGKYKNCGY